MVLRVVVGATKGMAGEVSRAWTATGGKGRLDEAGGLGDVGHTPHARLCRCRAHLVAVGGNPPLQRDESECRRVPTVCFMHSRRDLSLCRSGVITTERGESREDKAALLSYVAVGPAT